MKSNRDKRNYIIIGLCLILVVMGVGYAAFSSLLTINGTANITNSWCVGFDQTKTNTYTASAGIQGGTVPTGTMSYSGTACETNYVPNASLTANFKQPGDEIEYTLTIKNKSSVTAAIKSIMVGDESVTTDTTVTKGNVQFIIHMPESTTLTPNQETTMKVVAKFQNNTDVTGPYSGESQSITVGINTEQDDGNGGMVTTYTGTVYRNNTNRVYNGDNINNAGTIWVIANPSTGGEYGDEYSTEAECQTGYEGKNSPSGYSCQERQTGLGTYSEKADTLNKTYYLKHDIVEDIVTNSYVCFISDTEHCMKGGDGGASFTQNTQIIKDYQVYNNLGNYKNGVGCFFRNTSTYCYGGSLYYINANSSGGVTVSISSNSYCSITANSSTNCVN